MAKKNMGLDYALIRYHRIGAPTEPRRVLGDRPVECALCHADKSVEDLVSTMERWWNKRYDRAALRALYGDDLTVNALRATLARGKPHEQAVAIAVLGQSGDRSAVPAIAAELAHDYPLVRYFAQRALETLTGAPVAIDVGAPAAEVHGTPAARARSTTASSSASESTDTQILVNRPPSHTASAASSGSVNRAPAASPLPLSLRSIAPASSSTLSDACAPCAIILPLRIPRSLRITITCFAVGVAGPDSSATVQHSSAAVW
jgi:hypothetical protein